MQVRTVDGVCYGPVQSISVGASPFTWTNPEACQVMVFLSGGTLSTVSLSPDGGVTWADMGLSCNHYPLNPGGQIKVTYLVIPGSMSYTPW